MRERNEKTRALLVKNVQKTFFLHDTICRNDSQFLSRRPFNFLCYRMRISSLTIGQTVEKL
jgi:hypothetical protein